MIFLNKTNDDDDEKERGEGSHLRVTTITRSLPASRHKGSG